MKISKEQKDLNRKKMILAAVDVMNEDGITDATMKKISQKAGMSEPVIYKYFPNRENLLLAYFEMVFEETKEELSNNSLFKESSFPEQVQMILSTQIEKYSKNKDFVAKAFRGVFTFQVATVLTELQKHRENYIEYMRELLNVAIESGEMQHFAYKDFIAKILWDYHLGIISYWTLDHSQDSAVTLQLIDKSLGLMKAFIDSKIVDGTMELVYFFLRQHIFANMGSLVSFGIDLNQKSTKKEIFENKKNKKK